MDKRYNASSVIYDKNVFDFVICYLAILYYGLDLFLNEIASNGLKLALFESFLSLNVIERTEDLRRYHFLSKTSRDSVVVTTF